MVDIDRMGGTAAVVKPRGTGDVQAPETRTWWLKLFGAAALTRVAAR